MSYRECYSEPREESYFQRIQNEAIADEEKAARGAETKATIAELEEIIAEQQRELIRLGRRVA